MESQIAEASTTPVVAPVLETVSWIYFALLGAAGGVAKVFGEFLVEPPTGWKTILSKILMNMFISGFSGSIGGFIASSMLENPYWIYATVGIFGWLGVGGLEMAANWLKSRRGIQ